MFFIIMQRPCSCETSFRCFGGATVYDQVAIVDCDPDIEVQADVSCVGGDGRLDITVENITNGPATYEASVGSLPARSLSLGSGEFGSITVTGRGDGPLPVAVTRNGISVFGTTFVVDCDPEPEVVIAVSCLAGAGRIDITLANSTGATATYNITAGTIERSLDVAANDSATTSITGRPNGNITIDITRNGIAIHGQTVAIDC